ncbi:cadmium resistance transporter [Paraburkholderia sp. SARCC-3016]|uniref:cadmium resistance transporter n=1 Tax=Paraburkholderia sp. SARCC-3016 TaxID=3058611 RepID=UPI00280809A8|nr:cadmium resistance transporter [Paraburkholderia sp. SARCC-3016]MDQ7981066.1 cadmium resistance transporter [Paraburkholderia sp. SARCC-3016]
MNTLPVLLAAVAAAYVSTNVDGYVLLLNFFGDARYRAYEIVAGQFVSVAAQMAFSVAIAQSAWLPDAPCIGLAGIVPLVAGLSRIARLGQHRKPDKRASEPETTPRAGGAGRALTVAIVATCGAVDNVLVYSSLLIGWPLAEISLATLIFVLLTAILCASAFLTARSHRSIAALRRVASRIAPFATTAIGLSLLIRFDTLGWIYSLA